jgi:hypothetical protein
MATTYDSTKGSTDATGIASGESTTTTVLDLSAGTDFTYSASAIEFSDAGAKLKSQYASDVLFAATYTSSLNGVYSKFGGSLVATTEGTVANTTGTADLSTADAAFKKMSYSGSLNFPVNGVGAVKYEVTPDYSGTPSTRQWYFSSSMADSSTVNQVLAEHHTDGRMYYIVYSSAAAIIYLGDFAWSPTADQTYEFYFHWDTGNGNIKFFIDGVQQLTSSATGSRDNRITHFKFGASESDTGTDYADFRFDNVLIFNAIQHNAGYTPGYTISETKFVTSDPTVESTNGFTAASLISFQAVTAASGSDGIKFYIKLDGTRKYWNGSAWANSNGSYAQSSTASDIHDNIETLLSGSANVKVGAVIHSADGSTTPTVSSVVLVGT